MPLRLEIVRALLAPDPALAWSKIFDDAWNTCAKALPTNGATAEVTRRDRETAALDLLLATGSWDLWEHFERAARGTAEALRQWWSATPSGRAVLILDGLSLREAPWLLHGARERGYTVHTAHATASELPGETTVFARALGFSSRSALENDGASSPFFSGAKTETLSIPWPDVAKTIRSEPDLLIWHHWPDNRVHELAAAGQGLEKLTAEVATELTGAGFWSLVERLTTGRRLVITSDHGYAATGLFADAPDDQARHLKDSLKAGRCATGAAQQTPWVPPVELSFSGRHGSERCALGRRKWKSQGGYPTLTHGGLTVLEVASPFIELSRDGVK